MAFDDLVMSLQLVLTRETSLVRTYRQVTFAHLLVLEHARSDA